MTEERRSRATEAFFGRRKGKPLRNQQVDTIENLLPLLKIDLESVPPQNLAALFPADVRSAVANISPTVRSKIPRRVSSVSNPSSIPWPSCSPRFANVN